MTNYKWSYVARGHYSTPENGGTVHVLDDGTVYKTHPTRKTSDITGSKADRYIESAQTKFPVRGKKRAQPEPEPTEKTETPRKETKVATPKKGVTKKKIGAAAKKLAKGAGELIGTTRAFVTEVGEAQERVYAKRKAPPPKAKKAKKAKTPSLPKKKAKTSRPTIVRKKKAKVGRPTIVRKKKATIRRAPPPQATEHPLDYLISGTGAMPPTSRRKAQKKPREQTLEEYLGF